MDVLYRVFLGVVLSVSITMAYGTLLVVLGTLQDSVLFLPPNLWLGLAVITLLLFLGGAYRGAYPRIGRWLGRSPAAPSAQPGTSTEIYDRLLELIERLEEARKRAGAIQAGTKEAVMTERLIRELEAEKRRLEEEAGRLW
jgi:hypothetical protein